MIQRGQPLDSEQVAVGENGSGCVAHLEAMAIGGVEEPGKRRVADDRHSRFASRPE